MTNEPNPIHDELSRTRRELLLLYEVGNLMRRTLKLDEIIFLILSAVTSHEGLGFNRAILFLLDESRRQVDGMMGVGPDSPERASTIWEDIDRHQLHLDGFLDIYRKCHGNIDRELNGIVRDLHIPHTEPGSILSQVITAEMPMLVTQPEARAKIEDPFLKRLNVDLFAVVPVRGRDHAIGALLVDNVSTQKPILRSEIRNLWMLADHAGLAIENALAFGQVLETSKKDSLTGLWNHGHFQDLLTQELRKSELSQSPTSLLLFDIDDFKKYNDQYGHQAGDKALKRVSDIARTVIRKGDSIARYGGEEFAVILSSTSKDDSLIIAEKLRLQIQNDTSKHSQADVVKPITISIGTANYPQDATIKDKLISCADRALYEAKKAGKNQAVAYRAP